MYHIWTNDNWELKCFSDHKTGNNSTVVSEQKKRPDLHMKYEFQVK